MAVRSAASTAIVVIALELASLGLLVLMAGVSNDVGNVMMILMIGFWLIYLVKESRALEVLSQIFYTLSENPSNKPGVLITSPGP